MAQMGGAFMAQRVGQLWQSELVYLGDMLRKLCSSGEYHFRSLHDHGFRSL